MGRRLRDLCCEPLERCNPFLLLDVPFGAGPQEISARATRACNRAAPQEELEIREALEDLRNPSDRRDWALWTAWTQPRQGLESRASAAVVAALSAFLGLGDTRNVCQDRALAAAAGYLGLVDCSPAHTHSRWQLALRTRADGLWHHLAVVYTGGAILMETVAARRESAYGSGQPAAAAGQPIDAVWSRAFSCWARTLGGNALWDRLVAAGELRPEQVDVARKELIEGLPSLLVHRLVPALDQDQRLTATRHARMLARLAREPEYALFAQPAQRSIEEPWNSLWMVALDREAAPATRLAVLKRLVLLRPNDPEAIDKALDCVHDLHEHSADAMAECLPLLPYLMPLLERVFGASPAIATLDANLLAQLERLPWVLRLVSRHGSPAERERFRPMFEIWSRHRAAEEAGENG